LNLYFCHAKVTFVANKDRDMEEPGAWIFRDIPRWLMRRAKAAAAIQGKSIRALVIELMEGHLKDLERKGILPKGE
jgi:hypothetical protein